MKRIFFATLLLALAMAAPIPAMAMSGNVTVRVPVPPPYAFSAPPFVIVMPDTIDVYFVPDVDDDLFFWDGWWWRRWDNRWYRSHDYNRGWGYYKNVPSFYPRVDPGWRGHYKNKNWYGYRWNYERIPYQQLQRDWKGWKRDRYWERQKSWGIQGYQPRTQKQKEEYRRQGDRRDNQRPEVQKQPREDSRTPRERDREPARTRENDRERRSYSDDRDKDKDGRRGR